MTALIHFICVAVYVLPLSQADSSLIQESQKTEDSPNGWSSISPRKKSDLTSLLTRLPDPLVSPRWSLKPISVKA